MTVARPMAVAKNPSSLMLGYLCGAVMAVGASISFAAARAGVLAGLAPDDMIFARFVVAGFFLLPFLMRWGVTTLAGIGWPRGLALLLTGGPLFALLQTGGYAFAPLAHGAVIAPSTVTILSTIAAAALLGERLTRSHIAGAILVVGGIVLISWHGLTAGVSGDTTWIGDILFIVSSTLWAGFTVLIRYWRLDAFKATAVIGVLSLCLVAPLYLAYRGPAHLMALPLQTLAVQGLVQGLIQAVITMIAYSRAVAILGVSRAVLFPAIVPAISILIGIPLIGEIPSMMQVSGLLMVSAGLFIAIGLAQRLMLRTTMPATRRGEVGAP